jgi:hypothetical protein
MYIVVQCTVLYILYLTLPSFSHSFSYPSSSQHLPFPHSYLSPPYPFLLIFTIGEWDFVYNDRKNRWLSELGMEDVKPRKRRSPGGDSIDYEKYDKF